MDVHPPQEPIHSWRGFFIHLITITIGLLIALGLEALVERAHHRSLAHEALATIREEINGNHRELSDNLSSVRGDEQRIGADIKQLRVLRSGRKLSKDRWPTRSPGRLSPIRHGKLLRAEER